MEDFYMNITSQNKSYDYSNISSPTVNNDYDNLIFILDVLTYITVSIGLPLTLVAICALYCQIQNYQVAPIYVINLLISDLIQLCCMILQVATTSNSMTFRVSSFIYLYTLMVSVGFMMCIALERYLVIAHPLWYRFRRTIKISVGVCVLVWAVPLLCVFTFYFWVLNRNFFVVFGVFLLLPLPLFIFFLGGTLKALSASCVSSDEKRRIVAVLILVLLIYTLLFLPAIIFFLSKGGLRNITLNTLADIFLQSSPLADLTLYIFMRKGTMDKFLSSVCCCRMDTDDTNSSFEFSSVQYEG